MDAALGRLEELLEAGDVLLTLALATSIGSLRAGWGSRP